MLVTTKALVATILAASATVSYARPMRKRFSPPASYDLEERDLAPRGACQEGEWRCSGNAPYQCAHGAWAKHAACAGGRVCVAMWPYVGCYYPWQADDLGLVYEPSNPETPTSPPTVPPATSTTPGAPSTSTSPVAPPNTLTTRTDTTHGVTLCTIPPPPPPSTSTTTTANPQPPTTTMATTTPAPPTNTQPPSGGGTFNAPHNVIYMNSWLSKLPSAAELGKFNRVMIAFHLGDKGPWDMAVMWTSMSQATRRALLDDYHRAGIAVMIAVFGATEEPTTQGSDPVALARRVAAFANEWEFDGVDIDYEDFTAFARGTAAGWLIPFQRELRNQLGPNKLISHAPVAPWFHRQSYSDGAYAAVHDAVGSTIDFYNLQYYNQNGYTDCTSLITDSRSTWWPGTSIKELHDIVNIPWNKLVLGKPINPSKANNGYMDAGSLGNCVRQGKQLGWPGSVMFWEWVSGAPSFLSQVLA